jgi:hypothetical protein
LESVAERAVVVAADERLAAAAYAHGWEVSEETHDRLRFRPRVP